MPSAFHDDLLQARTSWDTDPLLLESSSRNLLSLPSSATGTLAADVHPYVRPAEPTPDRFCAHVPTCDLEGTHHRPRVLGLAVARACVALAVYPVCILSRIIRYLRVRVHDEDVQRPFSVKLCS